MNQIALALEHYWHLRSQGFPPLRAADHVNQRFGVDIDYISAEDGADNTVVRHREPSTDFGTDFCKTIFGTSTGPAYS